MSYLVKYVLNEFVYKYLLKSIAPELMNRVKCYLKALVNRYILHSSDKLKNTNIQLKSIEQNDTVLEDYYDKECRVEIKEPKQSDENENNVEEIKPRTFPKTKILRRTQSFTIGDVQQPVTIFFDIPVLKYEILF